MYRDINHMCRAIVFAHKTCFFVVLSTPPSSTSTSLVKGPTHAQYCTCSMPNPT